MNGLKRDMTIWQDAWRSRGGCAHAVFAPLGRHVGASRCVCGQPPGWRVWKAGLPVLTIGQGRV